MGLFFITQDAADDIKELYAKVTTEDIKAATGSDFSAASPVATVDDDKVAHIEVKGPMFPTRNRIMSFFGRANTGYDEIAAGIDNAEQSGASKIVFHMDTPGGAESGLYDIMGKVRNTSIPTETHVGGTIASAGYFLGSQTDTLIASNPANIIGSVGIVQTSMKSDMVEIVNPESPDKRLALDTPEGKAKAESLLSSLYNVYAPLIASGRDTDVETVNKDFGKGGLMTAKDALRSGMIDAIGFESAPTGKKTAGVPATNRRMDMNREQLKAENPELLASLIEEGKTAAQAEYREHAKAHMDLAAMSEDYERAAKDMSEMTACGPQAMTHHTTQAVKKGQIAAREGENAGDLGNEGGENGGTGAAGEGVETDAEFKEAFAATGFEVDCE